MVHKFSMTNNNKLAIQGFLINKIEYRPPEACDEVLSSGDTGPAPADTLLQESSFVASGYCLFSKNLKPL